MVSYRSKSLLNGRDYDLGRAGVLLRSNSQTSDDGLGVESQGSELVSEHPLNLDGVHLVSAVLVRLAMWWLLLVALLLVHGR